MNLFLAFIAFNIIVLVHEIGHFLMAKLYDIKVLEFSIFIGPKLFSIQRGETMYSLRLLPIMAYVKMEGEEEASESERAFSNKPVHARALTALGGPAANLIFAALVLVVLFSFMGYTTTTVDQVAEGSPAYNASIRSGDVILKYDGKPVHQPMDVFQFLYVAKGAPARVEVRRGAEKFTTTIVPEIIPESEVYMIGVTFASNDNTGTVGSVLSGYPAEEAGILPGDRIVKLNETPVSTSQDVLGFMKNNGGKPVKITIMRNDAVIVKEITPKVQKIPEQYEIGLSFVTEKGNVFGALKQSVLYTYSVAKSVGYSLVWLITGKAQLNQMMGPIGIVSTIGDVVEQGPNIFTKIIYLFQMTSLMSIAVGATQLIPFPMLDGSKLLLLGIEAIRKKPIPPEKEAYISIVGFVLLILFAIYVSFNDIMRIIGG